MSDFTQSRHGYTPEEVDEYINTLKLDYEDRLSVQKERIFELVERTKKLTEELESYKKKDDEISSALMNAVSKARDIEQEAELRYENELSRLHIFHTKWVRYYNEIKQRYPMNDELMSVEKFLLEMNKILGSDAEIVKTPETQTESRGDVKFVQNRQEFLRNYQEERKRIREQQTERTVSIEDTPQRNNSEKRFTDLLAKYDNDNAATIESRERQLSKVTGFNPIEKINRYIQNSASNKPQISDSGFDMNEVLNPGSKLDLSALCKELGLMDDDQ